MLREGSALAVDVGHRPGLADDQILMAAVGSADTAISAEFRQKMIAAFRHATNGDA